MHSKIASTILLAEFHTSKRKSCKYTIRMHLLRLSVSKPNAFGHRAIRSFMATWFKTISEVYPMIPGCVVLVPPEVAPIQEVRQVAQ